MSRICPRCSNMLLPRKFGAEHLDGCTNCGGLWFERDELNRLTRDPGVGLMEVEKAFTRAITAESFCGEMACPCCAIPLTPFALPHSPDIPLFFCSQCKGIWLDEGEMEMIAARVASTRASRPAAPAPAPEPIAAAAGVRSKPHSPPGVASTPGDVSASAVVSTSAVVNSPAPAANPARHRARSAVGFLLSVPCEACKTTNPASSLVCWACGKPLQSREVLHLCPRCDVPLDELEEGEFRIDTCGQCAGVWLAEGRLSVYLQLDRETCTRLYAGLASQDEVAPPEGTHALHCPSCHYEIQFHAFGSEGSLPAGLCVHCKGIWFDTGGFQAVYDLVQGEGFLHVRGEESDVWGRG